MDTNQRYYSAGIEDPWTGSEEDRRFVQELMRSWGDADPLECLIPTLHRIQGHFRYVPEEAAIIISREWHIPVTDIFGVVTFYADFSTEPMGRNVLFICEGAACYFMGGMQLGEAASARLGVEYGETTPDGNWTLRRADFCFGACHLAPLVDVNHEIIGPLSEDGLREVIDNPPQHPHEEAYT